MGKTKSAIDYIEILRKLKQAGVSNSPQINRKTGNIDNLPSLQQRVDKLLGIVKTTSRPLTNMLFFVMYDIESNKVRYNVVKYLERMGCMRIQKSIFLADIHAEKYHIIKEDLAAIQALYDNHDSIILCPILGDLLQSMKIIGKSINIDLITHNKTTVFF